MDSNEQNVCVKALQAALVAALGVLIKEALQQMQPSKPSDAEMK